MPNFFSFGDSDFFVSKPIWFDLYTGPLLWFLLGSRSFFDKIVVFPFVFFVADNSFFSYFFCIRRFCLFVFWNRTSLCSRILLPLPLNHRSSRCVPSQRSGMLRDQEPKLTWSVFSPLLKVHHICYCECMPQCMFVAQRITVGLHSLFTNCGIQRSNSMPWYAGPSHWPTGLLSRHILAFLRFNQINIFEAVG